MECSSFAGPCPVATAPAFFKQFMAHMGKAKLHPRAPLRGRFPARGEVVRTVFSPHPLAGRSTAHRHVSVIWGQVSRSCVCCSTSSHGCRLQLRGTKSVWIRTETPLCRWIATHTSPHANRANPLQHRGSAYPNPGRLLLSALARRDKGFVASIQRGSNGGLSS